MLDQQRPRLGHVGGSQLGGHRVLLFPSSAAAVCEGVGAQRSLCGSPRSWRVRERNHLHSLPNAKAICLCLLASVGTLDVWGQGQISVGNRVRVYDIDAPVFDSDCRTRLEGTGYLAQAYVGFSPDSLSPLGSVWTFRTGDSAGYVHLVTLTVPGTVINWVYVQLRAWEAEAGTSYEGAVVTGGKHGFSNIVPMLTVLPPGTPDVPVGLQSFCLVPEATSGELLLVGGLLWALAGMRRKRPSGRRCALNARTSPVRSRPGSVAVQPPERLLRDSDRPFLPMAGLGQSKSSVATVARHRTPCG